MSDHAQYVRYVAVTDLDAHCSLDCAGALPERSRPRLPGKPQGEGAVRRLEGPCRREIAGRSTTGGVREGKGLGNRLTKGDTHVFSSQYSEVMNVDFQRRNTIDKKSARNASIYADEGISPTPQKNAEHNARTVNQKYIKCHRFLAVRPGRGIKKN